MLLPYYIAAGNIEHEYFERMGEYLEFEGLCFADTLDLFKGAQMTMFSEENSERVARELEAPITVIIGNPPYNMGQKNENDNNKNRSYPKIDAEIKKTYSKQSKATLQNKLYDAYVRFFKWASERLNGGNGVICFVSNNSFLDQHAFDGMRSEIAREFNHIWHLDLHGNVRKNPKLSGTTHNAFGIQVGVGITILARNSQSNEQFIRYHRVPEFWRRIEKLEWLIKAVDLDGVEWQELTPNAKNAWLTEGLQEDFETFAPLGTKVAKASFSADIETIFRAYSLGVVTSRDDWVYDWNEKNLKKDMELFVSHYNSEVERYIKEKVKPEEIDDFVNNEPSFLKWTDRLKEALKKGIRLAYDEKLVRTSLYRPFAKQFLYFDDLLNQRRYQQHRFFPTSKTQNRLICLSGIGHDIFQVLMTDGIPELKTSNSTNGGTQCFPLYTFTSDGEMQSDNVTPWAVEQFGGALSREEIFYATYALLHHPVYRQRYAENLKRELPRIPVTGLDGHELARIGRALGDLHVGFESAPELDALRIIEAKREKGEKVSFRVEAMKWNKEKTQLTVNPHFTLSGFTPEMFAYKLGNRSALDWVVESFRVKKDARSGLESDPNRADDPQYILRLVRRVAGIALETQNLIGQLPAWPER